MQFVRDELAKVGIGLDVVGLDVASVIERVAERATTRPSTITCCRATRIRRAISTGGCRAATVHMWNPRQPTPATPWEAEIDAAMQKQAATLGPRRAEAPVHGRAARLPRAQPRDLLRGLARLRRDEPPRPRRRARAEHSAGALGRRRAVGRPRRALIAHDALSSRGASPARASSCWRCRRPRSSSRALRPATSRRRRWGSARAGPRSNARGTRRTSIGRSSGSGRNGSAGRCGSTSAPRRSISGRCPRWSASAPRTRRSWRRRRCSWRSRWRCRPRSSRRRVRARSPAARFARSRCCSCRCRRLSARSCSSSSPSGRRGCPPAG